MTCTMQYNYIECALSVAVLLNVVNIMCQLPCNADHGTTSSVCSLTWPSPIQLIIIAFLPIHNNT